MNRKNLHKRTFIKEMTGGDPNRAGFPTSLVFGKLSIQQPPQRGTPG